MPAEKTAPTIQSIGKPVLAVTRYERVSSTMLAVVMSLAFGVLFLFTIWLTNRPEKAQSEAELEIVELSGGVEDGAPDETLRIDSPAEAADDASIPDVPSEEHDVAEAIESLIELSDDASMQLPQQFDVAAENTGKEGSATGTGRRALGLGPGSGGFPRHQRWFVRFSDRGTLDEYAAQLDYFGIELGLLVGSGELAYVSNLSSPNPTVRRVKSGKGENRLFFTWQGGQRRGADLQLLEKAGLRAEGSTIFHFYPTATEKMLAEAEIKYRNRKVKDIRRTYFTVVSNRDGNTFEVTNQAYY
jgi:hypothetical protein